MNDVSYELVNMWQISPEGMNDCVDMIDTYGAGRDSVLHWHHALEILLMIEGSVTYTADCAARTYNAGDICLINSQTIHKGENSRSNGHVIALVLRVTDEFLAQLLPEQTPCRFAIPYGTETEELLRRDLYEMARIAQESRDAADSILMKSCLLHLVYLLFRDCRLEEQPHTNSCEYSKAAIRYVTEHYAEPVTLDEIATAVGLQKNYFCRCFKQDTGMTFAQYLNQVRLNIALALMEKGDARMLDCALQAGFSSEKVMIDWCRRVHHMTPMQYVRSLHERP